MEGTHALTIVPAGLALCCSVLDRRATRWIDVLAGALMLAAMAVAASSTGVIGTLLSLLVLWASALVAAFGYRRAGAAARSMALHRVMGTIAMGVVMVTVLVVHGSGVAAGSWASHHGGAMPTTYSGSAAIVGVLAAVAFCSASAVMLWREYRRAPHRGPSSGWQEVVEAISMAAMVAVMALPLL